MKKLVWAICSLVFLIIACNSNQSQTDAEEVDSGVSADAVQPDTLTMEEVEEALPARADELFDDFLFNYSQDSLVQMRRTAFPLPYYRHGEKETIARAEWDKDPLFSNMEFYSVLYDRSSDMELEKDTALNRVQMEYLYLDKMQAKRYHFLRNEKGFWILYKIVEEPLTEERDPVDFLAFYEKFATDSVYQREHVSPQLNFITFDPDDEFKTVDFNITVDQWFAYRPKLPVHTLTQVNYGQNAAGLEKKIVNFRGSSNGFNNTLVFERKNESWQLTSFEDTSE